MTLWERSLAVLGVQGGEARLVGRMLALYLVLIAALVLIQSMAFGLFIAEYGSQRLPFAYLAIAGLATLVSFGYLRLGAAVSFPRLLTFNLAFLTLGSLLLWAGLRSPLAGAATFLLPVWFQIFVTLVNLVVWPLAMRLFDVRQGKRVFGLIGAGNWIANMVGGLVVAPLVAWWGPANLLALAAVVVLAAWLLLRGILRDHLPPTSDEAVPGDRAAAATVKAPFGVYAWRIFAYTAAWWLVFYFVDNVFYAQAGSQYPDAESLTAFIGRFLSLTGAVALFTTVVLTSRVLRRFGLGAGLLTLPVLVTIAVTAIAFGGTLGVPAVALFWLASVAKLSNVAFGFSLSQTSHNVMYQALEGRARERVQTVAEGIVQPVAIGVAGGSLLLLTTGFELDAVGLALVLTPLAAVWIVLTLRVAGAYPSTLAQTLKRRRWGDGVSPPLDATALSLLRAGLQDERPGPVLFALERLGPGDAGLTTQVWQRVLAHPAESARAAAVARLAAAGSASAALLEERLPLEPAPPIRADLIRALAGMSSASAVEEAARALSESYPETRAAAIATLLTRGGPAQATRAAEALAALASSSAAADRALAARVVGEVGLGGEDKERWTRTLAGLLSDGRVEVRREALGAMCRLRAASLWPTVARVAGLPGSARNAERALLAGGDAALNALFPLVERGDLPAGALVVIARAAGRAVGSSVEPLLAGLRTTPYAVVRQAALEAIASRVARHAHHGSAQPAPARAAGSRAAATQDEAWVRAELEASARHAGVLSQVLAVLPDDPGADLVADALQDAWRRERDIVVLLAAAAGDAAAVLDARAALSRGAHGARARALEVVEVSLPAGLRPQVLPWLDSPAPQRARPTAFSVDRSVVARRLDELIAGEAGRYFGPWVRACALHLVGAVRLAECEAAARAATADPEPLVATAARTACRLLGVAGLEVEESMLSSLERAIILKGVRFFSEAPSEVLADVAALLGEVDVAAGDDVVRQGEDGDSLYVVVDGELSVHDGGLQIESLTEGEAFGEMALLDPGPRSATVTATTPARLLRLSREPFIDLLHERPEVAVGIMAVLVRRLRSRVGDLAALEHRAAGEVGAHGATAG